MIMKKAILTMAVLILAPLFLVHVTTSTPYDPWYDFDDDGDIDIYDIVDIAGRYGTSGDSTRNVSVTNFPLDDHGNIRISEEPTSKLAAVCVNKLVSLPGGQTVGYCDISGWHWATVWLYSYGITRYYVEVYYRMGNISYHSYVWQWEVNPGWGTIIYHFGDDPLHVPELEIVVQGPDSGQANVTIYVYMTR